MMHLISHIIEFQLTTMITVMILQRTQVQVIKIFMKEIDELLELTRENNLMLKSIMNYLYNHS